MAILDRLSDPVPSSAAVVVVGVKEGLVEDVDKRPAALEDLVWTGESVMSVDVVVVVVVVEILEILSDVVVILVMSFSSMVYMGSFCPWNS